MQVSVTVTGDKEVITKLRSLGSKLLDFSVAFAVLGRELTDYYEGKVFSSQGGALGEPWARLSPAYAARKGKMYPGRGTLVATGQMQRSFTTRVTPSTLIIGNDAPYFKYHQSTEERNVIPRRAMLGVNSEVKSIVKQIIEQDISTKIQAAM